MSFFDITFNKEKFVIDIVAKHQETLKVTFVITDLNIDCPYFVWENVELPQSSAVWISPLSSTLISVAKASTEFSGFRCKVYYNNRLIQTEELSYNNVGILPVSLFLTPEMDTVGHSYLDLFYSDLCDNINFEGVVIDAGANVGFFTLLAKNRKANRIYSIEADTFPFFYLKRNFMNDSSIILINKALSTSDNTTTFFYSLGTSVASSEVIHMENSLTNTVDTISLQTLLNVEETVNLVKLDIEGSEFNVIRAVPDHMFNKVNQFFIEFHSVPTEIENRLKNLGFSIEYRRSTSMDTTGFMYAKNLNI
jgi:FkbM family methyltransferase